MDLGKCGKKLLQGNHISVKDELLLSCFFLSLNCRQDWALSGWYGYLLVVQPVYDVCDKTNCSALKEGEQLLPFIFSNTEVANNS